MCNLSCSSKGKFGEKVYNYNAVTGKLSVYPLKITVLKNMVLILKSLL